MLNGQVNHHWLEWNEFATDHIRWVSPEWRDGHAARRDRHKWRFMNDISAFNPDPNITMTVADFLVEFSSPLPPEYLPTRMVAQSMAPFVLPYLHYQRWHRSGGAATFHRMPGLMRWLSENLTTSFLGIRTDRLMYITTDDADDFTLIKIRCNEYIAKPGPVD